MASGECKYFAHQDVKVLSGGKWVDAKVKGNIIFADGVIMVEFDNGLAPRNQDSEEIKPVDGGNSGYARPAAFVAAEPKPTMTVYIAGPMRGYVEYNFPEFYRAEKLLATQYPGCKVYNPARMDNEEGFDEKADGFTDDGQLLDHLRKWFPRDVEAIAKCDTIYLLEGWQSSAGATIEKQIAEMFGLTVMYETQPNVCSEALRLVYGDRGEAYGHPIVEHQRIADYWSTYLAADHGLSKVLSALDVAHMMILLKIARAGHKYREDNLIDVAGYALCAQRIHKADTTGVLE